MYQVLETTTGSQEKANAVLAQSIEYTNQATSGGYVTGLVSDNTSAAQANTATINLAITNATNDTAGASINSRGQTVTIPAGFYYVNDSIQIDNVYGLTLRGVGGQSALAWVGDDDTKPIILMSNARLCHIHDLLIKINNAAYAAIQCNSIAGGTIAASKNKLSRIFVDSNGTASYGVIFGGNGSADNNNDFNHVEDVSVTGYSIAGFAITHSQSYANLFVNCNATSYQDAQYGIYAGNAIGSFRWTGGGFNGHSVADISIGRSGQPCIVEGFSSEGSQHVLELITEEYHHVSLRDFRFAANAISDGGSIIKSTGISQVQLEITNSRIGTNGGNPTPPLTVAVALDALSSFVFSQNEMTSSAVDIFPTSKPTSGTGNAQITDEMTRTRQALTW